MSVLGTIRQQFADTMLEVGQKDPRLIVLVADIDHFRLQPFAKACPGRYYNVGICEPTMMSMAAGLSKIGFYLVVHTISSFLTERSLEQIKDDFGYQKLGVNIIPLGSAFDYGYLGTTHHTYSDFAILKNIENSEILYPATTTEFNLLFKQTYRNGKITFMRICTATHDVPIPNSLIKVGKGILIKKGKNLTIVAAGPQLRTAVDALDQLRKYKFDAEIIYVPTIKPFDRKLVAKSIAKTGRCLVIEEHAGRGGVLEEVLLSANGQKAKIAGINLGARFIHMYGSYDQMSKAAGFTVENVVHTARQKLSKI